MSVWWINSGLAVLCSGELNDLPQVMQVKLYMHRGGTDIVAIRFSLSLIQVTGESHLALSTVESCEKATPQCDTISYFF